MDSEQKYACANQSFFPLLRLVRGSFPDIWVHKYKILPAHMVDFVFWLTWFAANGMDSWV